ncbi:MAG: TetR/AcrR family transcriptional regulator [Clostridia bacterium]|nr:TetR/AcrR family transcriptional regulator [Clostridia bacterium]
MARNKYPEETVEKILEISYRLFQEKGYDHTTIQDIVTALGMSKGAVYHHFKSKEDILDKITDKYYDSINWFGDIFTKPGLTGLEKLRKILSLQLSDPRKLEVDQITMSLTKNPQLLALTVNSSMYDAAPMVARLVQEGIQDGSIQTDYPKEIAEVLMLILNIWVGVYTSGREDFIRKIDFIKAFTDQMGVNIIDDALYATAVGYFDQVISQLFPPSTAQQ